MRDEYKCVVLHALSKIGTNSCWSAQQSWHNTALASLGGIAPVYGEKGDSNRRQSIALFMTIYPSDLHCRSERRHTVPRTYGERYTSKQPLLRSAAKAQAKDHKLNQCQEINLFERITKQEKTSLTTKRGGKCKKKTIYQDRPVEQRRADGGCSGATTRVSPPVPLDTIALSGPK